MAEINFQEVEQFASLFPAGEVPKYPQHRDDLAGLNVTQRSMVQGAMPELWQRLHGGNEAQLPADVLLRMHKGELRVSDVDALRKAGLEAAALSLEASERERVIQEGFARMEAEKERRAAAREVQMANAEANRLASMQMAQMQAKAAHGVF